MMVCGSGLVSGTKIGVFGRCEMEEHRVFSYRIGCRELSLMVSGRCKVVVHFLQRVFTRCVYTHIAFWFHPWMMAICVFQEGLGLRFP